MGDQTGFYADLGKGKIVEQIFKNHYCGFFNLDFEDVTANEAYRKRDIDFILRSGFVDVKSLKYNPAYPLEIVIEDYTNINECLAPLSAGWIEKSDAHFIFYVDKATGLMVALRFSDWFKSWYHNNKNRYEQILNKVSFNESTGAAWQSAFRRVPFEDIPNGLAMKILLNCKKDAMAFDFNVQNSLINKSIHPPS